MQGIIAGVIRAVYAEVREAKRNSVGAGVWLWWALIGTSEGDATVRRNGDGKKSIMPHAEELMFILPQAIHQGAA